jgi:hypothetical protein
VITQYQRRRNQNPAFTVQKQNYRIQVDGSTKTWKLAKKTQTPSAVGPSLVFTVPANSMYIPVFPL